MNYDLTTWLECANEPRLGRLERLPGRMKSGPHWRSARGAIRCFLLRDGFVMAAAGVNLPLAPPSEWGETWRGIRGRKSSLLNLQVLTGQRLLPPCSGAPMLGGLGEGVLALRDTALCVGATASAARREPRTPEIARWGDRQCSSAGASHSRNCEMGRRSAQLGGSLALPKLRDGATASAARREPRTPEIARWGDRQCSSAGASHSRNCKMGRPPVQLGGSLARPKLRNAVRAVFREAIGVNRPILARRGFPRRLRRHSRSGRERRSERMAFRGLARSTSHHSPASALSTGETRRVHT